MILREIQKTTNIREIAFRALNSFEKKPQHISKLYLEFCPNGLEHRDKTLPRANKYTYHIREHYRPIERFGQFN